MSETESLKRIEAALLDGENVGKALRLLQQFVTDRPDPAVSGVLESVSQDYELMKDFMLKGYHDDKRSMLYEGMLRKLYRVWGYLRVSVKVQESQAYRLAATVVPPVSLHPDDIRRRLEGFVQDVTMLSLEPEAVGQSTKSDIYSTHQTYIERLFNAVLVSSQWDSDTAEGFEQLLLSPTIDANDAQLLVSAVMLSAMNVFDIRKVMTLMAVYCNTSDEHIRQRALVGWVFALPEKLHRVFRPRWDKVSELCKDEAVRRDLLELQMQVFHCLNAERDNDKLQHDIIPNLMKNNHLQITRFGIKEKEEDPMQDILDPGAADRAMEEVEGSFKRMADMQRAGADIYFGGFSQMKRFPFFGTLSNWFCPFYVDHPALQSVNEQLKDYKFMAVLLLKGPFCDSDKYSFALALSTIIDKLPANVREMLNSGETMGAVDSGLDTGSAAYIRRTYLQDLYRFFRVYPYRDDFRNPFECESPTWNALFFLNDAFNRDVLLCEARQLKGFLLKRKHYEAASEVCDRYVEPGVVEDIFIRATLAVHYGHYTDAQAFYAQILDKEPDNLRALRGLAQADFHCGDFESAVKGYSALLEKQPDNKHYALNLAISQINSGAAEQGVNGLFRLNLDFPDDKNIRRAIAWGQMFLCKPSQAETIYDDLLASAEAEDADYLNAGYCKWFVGKVSAAADLFKMYVQKTVTRDSVSVVTIAAAFADDLPLLTRNNISDTDIRLMEDIVDS